MKCKMCDIDKTLMEFSTTRDMTCKVCVNRKRREYYQSNKGRFASYNKKHRENNKELIKKEKKTYRENNSEKEILLPKKQRSY